MYQEARSDDWRSKLQSQDSNEREQIMQGTNFELVGDFMEAFGQDVEVQPTWPDFNTRELRVDLIQEEVDELDVAFHDNNLIEIIDALSDSQFKGVFKNFNLKTIGHSKSFTNRNKNGAALSEENKTLDPDHHKFLGFCHFFLHVIVLSSILG